MSARTSRLVEPAASAGVHGRSIPSLDGLRALSVSAVVVAHIVWSRAGQPGAPWATAAAALGPIGVHVFFVISGYLITTLLMQDEDSVGQVRLGRFYLRRVLRIFPPYYTYLLCITLLTIGGTLPATGRAWPAWLYLSNILPTGNWFSAQSWSLAIEEQFYLTWPFVLAHFGRRRAARFAGWACVVMPLLRAVVAAITRSAWVGSNVAFDFLAVGCLLALRSPELEATLRRWTSRGRQLAALTLGALLVEGVLTVAPGRLGVALELGIAESAEALLIGLVVAWCVAHPRSAAGRALNARPLRAVGVGSYSIYLWQQLFFGPQLAVYTIPEALAATAAMAGASYLFIERPSLALRRRIEDWWARRQGAREIGPGAVGPVASIGSS